MFSAETNGSTTHLRRTALTALGCGPKAFSLKGTAGLPTSTSCWIAAVPSPPTLSSSLEGVLTSQQNSSTALTVRAAVAVVCNCRYQGFLHHVVTRCLSFS